MSRPASAPFVAPGDASDTTQRRDVVAVGAVAGADRRRPGRPAKVPSS